MKSEIGLGFFLAVVEKDQGNSLCTELGDLPRGTGRWWLMFSLFLELPQVCTRHRLAFIPTKLWMFCCEMPILLLEAFVEKALLMGSQQKALRPLTGTKASLHSSPECCL